MNAGTKVFLAVVALLVGVMILYYGVLQTGDHPNPAQAANNPEAPTVRTSTSKSPEVGHLTQPVLRNDPKPATPTANSAPITIPPANDPLADFGATPTNNTSGFLTDSVSGASPNTPAGNSVTNAPSKNPTPTGSAAADPRTSTTPNIKPGTTTPKPADVQRSPQANKPASIGTPAEGVEYTTYAVKAGDTGVSIAQDWFGDGNKWTLISKANPMVDFNRLKIGQKLRLPPKDAAKETVKPPTITGKPTETAIDPNTYVVKSGDTLSSIARAKYEDGSLWELIYETNKKTIGDDPSNLKVGMKLTIPAKPVKTATGSSR